MTSSRDEAQTDLARYAEAFERCVSGALQEYVANYGGLRHKHSKRSEASIIHDLMVDHFTAAFGTLEEARGDVAVHKKGNLRQVVVTNGKYKLKLKKLDQNLLTRNIPTQAVLRFVWQGEQLSFKEVPAPTNLHIGYQLPENEASLTASRVWIMCPRGDHVWWKWELALAQEKADQLPTGAEVVDLRPETKAAGKRRRVSLKATVKEERAGKTSKADGGDGGASSG